ncbi:MAG: DUF4386 domain-containing protein [Xanthomonadales bacterium]|nr:DUF4386 domain-containing protein [Xanthomonadales bacterium]
MNYRCALQYARVAGFLLLISLVAGSFGEMYAPMKIIVPDNAAATAKNILSSDLLFRLGFASYLVEGICNVAILLVFYVLLRPVQKNIALLAVFFGLIGISVFAVAELFYVAPLLILGGADYLNSFTPGQLNTLALLSLNLYGYTAGILMAFGGACSLFFGYLILKSGYIPPLLGALLALAGIGFVIRNFALIIAPAYAYDWLFLPMIFAYLSLTLWFLVRGVDELKWKERAVARE